MSGEKNKLDELKDKLEELGKTLEEPVVHRYTKISLRPAIDFMELVRLYETDKEAYKKRIEAIRAVIKDVQEILNSE